MITVLLAAWNGESYIEEQLDSILNQRGNEEELEVLVSDDGSTDRTREILARYAARRRTWSRISWRTGWTGAGRRRPRFLWRRLSWSSGTAMSADASGRR